MSTGCEFHADALVDRAAGRLDAARRERLDRHLAECPDCRESLEVIRAVQRTPVSVPDGLERRVRSAVHAALDGDPVPGDREAPEPRATAPGRWTWRAWRPFAVPLAAAAALALVWLGVDGPSDPGGTEPASSVATEGYEPFGAWPASDGVVAGEPLLSELTVEELERLLEEMES